MSQRQLADLLGVSQPAVAKWESGRNVPKGETLERIEEILEQ